MADDEYTKTKVLWLLLHEEVALMICRRSIGIFKSSSFFLHGFFDL